MAAQQGSLQGCSLDRPNPAGVGLAGQRARRIRPVWIEAGRCDGNGYLGERGEVWMALAEAKALKLQARLEDLDVWEMEKVKESKKGSKIYTYWMASWREGDKTRNVHLGSTRVMDADVARQKARRMKAEALGMREQQPSFYNSLYSSR